jgi:hypothetical protein
MAEKRKAHLASIKSGILLFFDIKNNLTLIFA